MRDGGSELQGVNGVVNAGLIKGLTFVRLTWDG